MVGGCQASFIDLRPLEERFPPDMAGVTPPDLSAPQLDFSGVDLIGFDFTQPPPPDLANGSETTLASGTFVGRAGHAAGGGASRVTKTDGTMELRFAADFMVTDVPGPVVVLTSRDTLGTAVDG